MAETNVLEQRSIYYRLVTLWVICEAFAGGIMHGIKIPFSGLMVSSLAVTCIVLIAYHVPSKTAIIKATVIVAIFKLMLSPHSPPTAYIAVFFQGLMGQLLFMNRRFFTAAAVILAVLSLVESAIQRILVLVIIYGNAFWNAVNQFIKKLINVKAVTNYSLWIAVIYILIHAVIGIFVGIYAVRLAQKSEGWKLAHPSFIIPLEDDMNVEQLKKKKRKRPTLILILWLVLLAALAYAYFNPGQSIITSDKVNMILLRSILIVLGWYLLFAPLVMMSIRKILSGQRLKNKQEVNEVIKLLPQTKYIFAQSWQLSANENGFKRLKVFLKILLINIL